MSAKGPVTPKGFRDVKSPLAKKRRNAINTIANVLTSYGFVPIETPTIEFAETLLGKYGEDEKLIYQFKDRGGRNLALRYDLTVPLARFIANNLGLLNPSFSRYQIGQAFRGENPQKGRYREFTQLDFDTLGSDSINEDAKVIAAAIESVRKLGLEKAKMAINDRQNFRDLSLDEIREIDKIYKIGKQNVKPKLLKFIEKATTGEKLEELFRILSSKYKLERDVDFFFDPSLARGLDYYTGTVFELKPTGSPEELSIGGGGRYDKLIGMFAGRDIAAVGFSFGIDRLIETLP
ncbi:histidine--tRNA ligase [Patescibacteria group bacterium]